MPIATLQASANWNDSARSPSPVSGSDEEQDDGLNWDDTLREQLSLYDRVDTANPVYNPFTIARANFSKASRQGQTHKDIGVSLSSKREKPTVRNGDKKETKSSPALPDPVIPSIPQKKAFYSTPLPKNTPSSQHTAARLRAKVTKKLPADQGRGKNIRGRHQSKNEDTISFGRIPSDAFKNPEAYPILNGFEKQKNRSQRFIKTTAPHHDVESTANNRTDSPVSNPDCVRAGLEDHDYIGSSVDCLSRPNHSMIHMSSPLSASLLAIQSSATKEYGEPYQRQNTSIISPGYLDTTFDQGDIQQQARRETKTFKSSPAPSESRLYSEPYLDVHSFGSNGISNQPSREYELPEYASSSPKAHQTGNVNQRTKPNPSLEIDVDDPLSIANVTLTKASHNARQAALEYQQKGNRNGREGWHGTAQGTRQLWEGKGVEQERLFEAPATTCTKPPYQGTFRSPPNSNLPTSTSSDMPWSTLPATHAQQLKRSADQRQDGSTCGKAVKVAGGFRLPVGLFDGVERKDPMLWSATSDEGSPCSRQAKNGRDPQQQRRYSQTKSVSPTEQNVVPLRRRITLFKPSVRNMAGGPTSKPRNTSF